MNEIILQAFENKQQIQFVYNGKVRIAEPQCYGIGTKGTELLRVYMIAGGSEPEPLFNVAKMDGLKLLNEYFTKPGPNYKKGDSAMRRIFREL